MVKHNNQKGFAALEIIIFVVVILAIGGIGYWALNSSSAMGNSRPKINKITPTPTKPKTPTPTRSQTPTPTPAKSQVPTPTQSKTQIPTPTKIF
jgi:hypothetical protein